MNHIRLRVRFVCEPIVRPGPDAILATASSALIATPEATKAVPTVFTAISEPVERGYVARPRAGSGLSCSNRTAPKARNSDVQSRKLIPLDLLAHRGNRSAEVIITAHNPAEVESAVAMAGRELVGG
jgi:hypothetical protein